MARRPGERHPPCGSPLSGTCRTHRQPL